MFNVLIFIIGAGIMFYMGLRSVLQRRRLQQKGQRVEARVAGTVQSRDGTAYLLEFERAAATACTTPKPPRARALPAEKRSRCTTTPKIPKRCMWRATAPFWGPRSSISVWPLCCWH